jgi:hypothetical protein
MDLITLLIVLIVFAAVVWGGFYVCDRAGFPAPVRWIWGAIFLVVMLYFLIGQIGGIGAFLHRPL